MGEGSTFIEGAVDFKSATSGRFETTKQPDISLLDTANGLLKRPEAKTWNEGHWYIRTEASRRIGGNKDLTETFVGTKDSETNTSFMVHSGASPGENSRYTIIRWVDLPDQEGGNVKGGGYMRTTYDTNGNAIRTETGKWKAGSGVANFNDSFWLSGEGSTNSLTDADLVGTPFEKKSNPLSEDELIDIQARFQRSKGSLDATFSERAAQYARIDDQMSEAAANYADVVRSGKLPAFIEGARQAHIRAVYAYYKATGRDPEIEREKGQNINDRTDDEEGEKSPRHAKFGDISIIEELANTLSPEEFEQYQENFKVFKNLVESTQDPAEKAFFSSRLVFRAIMGIEPESSFFGNEGRVLFKALERVGAKDRFAVLIGGKYSSDLVFIHTQAAEKVLRQYSSELGLQLPQGQLSREQVVEYVQSLYNQPDVKKANYATGLFSGFPKDAVDYFTTHNNDLAQYPLRPLDANAVHYLTVNDPANLDMERILNVFVRDYLQLGDALPAEIGSKIGIDGFGTTFTTSYPPSEEVLRYCQKLLEMDRRLGITKYIKQVQTQIHL